MTAKELDKAGLGIDFKVLKAQTKELLNKLDHKYLNELDCFNGESPSSENIARFLYYELGKELNGGNVTVAMITVWESDAACASYYEE